MFVQTRQQLVNSLTAAIAALTASPTLHLFKNNFTPTNISTIADFTEADYTGYAASTVAAWIAVAWQSQGAAVAYAAGSHTFQPSGTTVGNVIYGYYLASGDMTPHLIGAELLSVPFSLASPLDQLVISPVLSVADGLIPGAIY